MIFSGEMFNKVLSGEKTVTRRIRPVKVGVLRAVQPGRGKFSQGEIVILSCEDDNIWYEREVADKGHVCKARKERQAVTSPRYFGSWLFRYRFQR